jgi:hypothetical protein
MKREENYSKCKSAGAGRQEYVLVTGKAGHHVTWSMQDLDFVLITLRGDSASSGLFNSGMREC